MFCTVLNTVLCMTEIQYVYATYNTICKVDTLHSALQLCFLMYMTHKISAWHQERIIADGKVMATFCMQAPAAVQTPVWGGSTKTQSPAISGEEESPEKDAAAPKTWRGVGEWQVW